MGALFQSAFAALRDLTAYISFQTSIQHQAGICKAMSTGVKVGMAVVLALACWPLEQRLLSLTRIAQAPAEVLMSAGYVCRQAILQNIRYDEEVARFANAAGVGVDSPSLLPRRQLNRKSRIRAGACSAISFSTGAPGLMKYEAGRDTLLLWCYLQFPRGLTSSLHHWDTCMQRSTQGGSPRPALPSSIGGRHPTDLVGCQ